MQQHLHDCFLIFMTDQTVRLPNLDVDNMHVTRATNTMTIIYMFFDCLDFAITSTWKPVSHFP